MSTEGSQLLLLPAIRRELNALLIEDNAVRRVPVVYHVQPFVDFPPQRLRAQITAEEDCLDRLSKLRRTRWWNSTACHSANGPGCYPAGRYERPGCGRR